MNKKNSTIEVHNTSQQLKKSVDIVRAPWKGSPYYENAEKWTHLFWGKNTVFNQLFEKLDLTHTIELAVGEGRHAELVAKKAGELVVMDVLDENLEVCRRRLKDDKNVTFRKCDGFSFDGIEDGWSSSIYCYDAMVHFSPDIVESYLTDSYRTLKNKGRALYHHSNYSTSNNQHYGLNPCARNHMTQQLFANLCKKANLIVLESTVTSWAGNEGLDCITLVEKV